MNLIHSLFLSTRYMLTLLGKYRVLLWHDIRIEFSKKYAGSVLGFLWVFLYPILLMCIYLFVFVGIFPQRMKEGGSIWDYVLWAFGGILPYLAVSDTLQSGCQSIKQNIHLVKNVVFPIELIPLRVVLLCLFSELVTIVVLFILVISVGTLSWHILWFPLAFLLQCMFLAGLVWILAVLAVFLQDITYFVNLSTFMLFFLAPICYSLENITGWKQAVLFLNPMTYIVEVFRYSLYYASFPSLLIGSVYILMCLGSFVVGAHFFMKFKDTLIDYE